MRAKFPDAILKNAGMVSVCRRWSNESGKRQENRKMVDSVSLYGLARKADRLVLDDYMIEMVCQYKIMAKSMY